MPYDEDTKVFDVAKPSKAHPDATSKPVIVGHKPQAADPMVKEAETPSAPATPIHVAMDDEVAESVATHSTSTVEPDGPEETHDNLALAEPEQEEEHQPNELTSAAHEEPWPPAAPMPTTFEPTNTTEPDKKDKSSGSDSSGGGHHFSSLSSLIEPDKDSDKQPKPVDADSYGHDPNVPPLAIPPGAGPRRRWTKILGWIVLLLVLVVIAGYLAIDAGLVKSDVKLPFHIFNKQKTSTSTAPPPTPAPVTTHETPTPTSSVPAGFTDYKSAGTNMSFAYPTAWGKPTETPDPGFSKRGGTNKSDSVHAYLINFSSNKDVQIAFTSLKYLPAPRDPQYYDFLQWCVGTNDGKFYKQILKFTSVDGVDTPSTITCDQGPLTDATKLDDSTIVQNNTKGTKGDLLGDVYTKNLNDDEFSVVHIKDATMKNSAQIKQLLATFSTGNAAPADL